MNSFELVKIKEWFNNYTSKFIKKNYKFDKNISLKIEHSQKVMSIAEKITTKINIKNEKINIALACALLHDIGRFEQFCKYKTFSDSKSEDHGVIGEKIIEELKPFPFLDNQTLEIIKKTVRYHNARIIPDFIDAESRFFLELTRDADKIDILRVITNYYNKTNKEKDQVIVHNLPDTPEISESVYKEFMAGEHINYDNLKTVSDFKVFQCSWFWDFNFTASLKILLEKNYSEKLISSLPDTEKGRKIKKQCNDLIAKLLAEKNLEWKEISREEITDCSIFKLYGSKRKPTNGKEATAYIIKAFDWVTIIPLIKIDGKDFFVMVRQYRHGSMDITTEFPAGTLEKGETAVKAAKRELEEETGFKAGKMTFLGSVNPNPAFLTNNFTAFLAEDLTQTGIQHLDENEYLNYELVPAKKVIKKMGSGDFSNGTMLMALMYYLREKRMISIS